MKEEEIILHIRGLFDTISLPVKIRVTLNGGANIEQLNKLINKKDMISTIVFLGDEIVVFLLDKKWDDEFDKQSPWLSFDPDKQRDAVLEYGLNPCRFKDQNLVSTSRFRALVPII